MILQNYLTLWWRKVPDFDVDDDIRFVIGHYRGAGPWIAQRLVYRIASRTGIAFRLKNGRPWIFAGFMTLSSKAQTNEPSGRSSIAEEGKKP